MRASLAITLAAALLCSCAAQKAVRRGPPPHPDVALEFPLPEPDRSQESLLTTLRALQQFHGGTPTAPERVAAVTGAAYLVAAHEPSCTSWWVRGGRPRGLTQAGPQLGLTLTPQPANPLSDEEGATSTDHAKERTNAFITGHRPTLLAELDAGRPVLVAGGWSGARWSDWGLIVRYDQGEDLFYGWTPGSAVEEVLKEPPEHVVLVQPAAAPTAGDAALARHAFTMAREARAGRLPAVEGSSPLWRFGKPALDVWRARLGRQPFCRLCGHGSWMCHRKAAQDVVRSLEAARLFLAGIAAALPEAAAPLVPQLDAAYGAAIDALAGSLKETVEAKFQSQAGQREMAFEITQLTKNLDEANRLEGEILGHLSGPPATP